MKPIFVAMALLLFAFGGRAEDISGPATRRFALIVGSNNGGRSRVQLRFAGSDAQAMDRLLAHLGGVDARDRLLLLDPSREVFLRGLSELSQRIAAESPGRQRIELVVFYSGHSDEHGLLFGEQQVSYDELRERIAALPADVRIAILDSCASGALTRHKGGKLRPPFLFDDSARVKGHAFLTSSSADEAAQESDRIGGSFFTHYLISGLRGAADTGGDGKVTLNEAYQYAFNETLARTERTLGGAQHPAYEMQLAGSGEVVITDLRVTSAAMVLSRDDHGRIFLRDAGGKLVAELDKQPGRPMELGLEPGRYTLTLEREGNIFQSQFDLADGQRIALSSLALAPAAVENAVARGEAEERPAIEYLRRAVELSLVPPIGLNGEDAGRTINNFAFSLIGSESAVLKGLSFSLGVAYVRENMQGAQISLLGNRVDGEVWGLQTALLLNKVGAQLEGLQVSVGFNEADSVVNGLQLTCGLNSAEGDVWFGQLSAIANEAKAQLDGVQLAGVFNSTRGSVRGMQAAAGFNLSGDLYGLQLSPVNIADNVEGLQIGVVNIADNAKGVQIGLVNISDELEGVPIGLISISRNGQNGVQFWADELAPFNFSASLGTRYFYTMATAGFRPLDGCNCTQWHLGMGVGGALPLGPLFVKLDVTAGTVGVGMEPMGEENVLVRNRSLLGIHLTKHLALFAGFSGNIFVSPRPVVPQLAISEFMMANAIKSKHGDIYVSSWFGAILGVEFSFSSHNPSSSE